MFCAWLAGVLGLAPNGRKSPASTVAPASGAGFGSPPSTSSAWAGAAINRAETSRDRTSTDSAIPMPRGGCALATQREPREADADERVDGEPEHAEAEDRGHVMERHHRHRGEEREV